MKPFFSYLHKNILAFDTVQPAPFAGAAPSVLSRCYAANFAHNLALSP